MSKLNLRKMKYSDQAHTISELQNQNLHSVLSYLKQTNKHVLLLLCYAMLHPEGIFNCHFL